jgi:arylsulfatase A
MTGRLLLFLLLVGTASLTCSGQVGRSQPNVVLILVDDLGWNNVSCYGNNYLKTPHIDRLAREGIKFNQAYVTHQCTPTRAALLTGQHTARLHMWHVIPKYEFPHAYMKEPVYSEHLSEEIPTLGDAMQQAGYRTALFGKWHLTITASGAGDYVGLKPSHAQAYGFDEVAPATDPPGYHQQGEKGVGFLTDQTIRFIRQPSSKPFFVLLSHHTIHGPVLTPPALVNKYQNKGFPEKGQQNATYLAALKHLDNSVGRLLMFLDEANLTQNTVVIFMSDNGGVDAQFDNAPLRAGKGSLYEARIRTPLLVRYPGEIKPGSESNALVQATDLQPTLLDLAGQSLDRYSLDGISIRPAFGGRDLPDRSLYWYAPLYDIQWGATPGAVARRGQYKLIVHFGDYIDLENGGQYYTRPLIELYDLANDAGETTNLAGRLSDVAQQLRQDLYAWMSDLELELPIQNSQYDKEKALLRGIKP